MTTPLVIFDCDGVLVDSEHIASTVFSAHLCRMGVDYSAEDCHRFFTGLSLASCKQHIAATHGITLTESFFTSMQEETFARFAQDLQPVCGVHAVLDFLDGRGWQYCVASSGSHAKMQFTLAHTGLFERLHGRLYSASDVAIGKPAPDLFLYAAHAQRYAATHCIVVEDSWPGIQAAHAAGMRSCAFGERHTETVRQMPDTVVFTDMSELPAILANMQK